MAADRGSWTVTVRDKALTFLIAIGVLLWAPQRDAFALGQSGQSVSQGRCAINPGWTRSECFVWSKVLAGKVADFNADPEYSKGHPLDPNNSAEWPENRVISASFLKAILGDDAYRNKIARKGVRIVGARVRENIDLTNAELNRELWLDDSLIDHDVDMTGVRTKFAITFDGSNVGGALIMARLKSESDVRLRDKGSYGSLDLTHADITGNVSLTSSTVRGDVYFTNLHVSGYLRADQANLDDVDAVDANIEGYLDLSRSTVHGKLDFFRVRINSDLTMSADENDEHQPDYQEVDLTDASVGGHIDLDGARVHKDLWLDEVVNGKGIFLRKRGEFEAVHAFRLSSGGQLEFSGSTVLGDVELSAIRVEGSVKMDNGAHFKKSVTLRNVNVGDNLNLDGATVDGRLDISASEIKHDLYLDGDQVHAQFQDVDVSSTSIGGDVFLVGAKPFGQVNLSFAKIGGTVDLTDSECVSLLLASSTIGGDLILTGANVSGMLFMESVHVNGHLHMTVGINHISKFRDVHLYGATIGGSVNLQGSEVDGTLDMGAIAVGQNLTFGQPDAASKFSDVDLRSAKIRGDLNFTNSTVSGPIQLSGATIEGSAWFNINGQFQSLDAPHAHVTGTIDLSQSHVAGLLNFEQIEVGDTVVLNGVFADDVILSSAKIGNNLLLVTGEFDKELDLSKAKVGRDLVVGIRATGPRWAPNSVLDLSNATIDSISDNPTSWPKVYKLSELSYRRLEAIDEAKSDDDAMQRVLPWLKGQDAYRPDTYERLAQIMRGEGRASMADDIEYQSKEDEREHAVSGHWLWMSAQNYLIGYGYGTRIWRSLLWAVFAIVVGRVWLWATHQTDKDVPLGWAYTIDMLIPILSLREANKTIELKGSCRIYFYIHKAFGYILLSFIATGLAGLAK